MAQKARKVVATIMLERFLIFDKNQTMKALHFFLILGCLFLIGCNSNPDKKDPESSKLEEQDQKDKDSLSTQNNSTAAEANFLIEDRAAGDFELGKPIPVSLENYSITKVQQTRTTEEGPTEETVYIVAEGDTEILSMLPAIDHNTGETTGDIGELRISSRKFKTAEGIGVGSTLQEFIDTYPDHRIWYTYVSDMYVVEAEGVEAQFLLDEEDFIGKMDVTSAMTPLKEDDFRKGADIRMIRMI